jgi:hypothetical protein
MVKAIALALCLVCACSKKDSASSESGGTAPAEGSAAEHGGGQHGATVEKMSDEDRAAARRKRLESMRQKLDVNNDGKLSVDELKNAPGRMHFDDPESIDTNHDGDISIDELEAAMKARRGQWKGRDHVGSAGVGSDSAAGSAD